jgi:hypothetical protein
VQLAPFTEHGGGGALETLFSGRIRHGHKEPEEKERESARATIELCDFRGESCKVDS